MPSTVFIAYQQQHKNFYVLDLNSKDIYKPSITQCIFRYIYIFRPTGALHQQHWIHTQTPNVVNHTNLLSRNIVGKKEISRIKSNFSKNKSHIFMKKFDTLMTLIDESNQWLCKVS